MMVALPGTAMWYRIAEGAGHPRLQDVLPGYPHLLPSQVKSMMLTDASSDEPLCPYLS